MRAHSNNPSEQLARTGVSIASTLDDVKSALQLVYDAYYRSGLIDSNPYEIRATPFHLLETTAVLVAKRQHEIACTMTLIRDGKLGLPMESSFPDEVAERRERGISCAEISCLADQRSDTARGFPLLAKLMSFAAQCAAYRGVHEVLIAVHPRHARFYQRYLGFELINDVEQPYDAVSGSPAVALSIDILNLQLSPSVGNRRLFGKHFPCELFRHQSLPYEARAELSMVVENTYVSIDYDDYVQAQESFVPTRIHSVA